MGRPDGRIGTGRRAIRRYPWVAASLWLLLCAAAATAQLPTVRLHMQAEALLDPLPFDRPFLLTGEAPPGTREVVVTFEELFDDGYALAGRPDVLAVFADSARARLDSLTSSNGSWRGDEAALLRDSLIDLLLDVAPAPKRAGVTDVMNLAPWRWGRWRAVFRRQVSRLVTPGALLDGDADGAALLRWSDGLTRVAEGDPRALDLAVDQLLAAARQARVAPAPASPRPPRVARWRATSEPVRASDSGGEDRWNRLARRLEETPAAAGGRHAHFEIVAPPLPAERTYVVRVAVRRELGAAEAETIARHLGADGGAGASVRLRVAQWVARIADAELIDLSTAAGALRHPGLTGRTVERRTTLLAATPADGYVGLDVGMLHVPEIGRTPLYVGANLYLRPVDKGVPLSRHGGLLRRLGLTVGLTLQSIEDDRRTRDDLVGSRSLVVGAGYRITQALRLGGGALLFRERDPETFPLTTSTSLTVSPYVSLSFDLDVGAQLRGLGRLFDPLKED